MGDDGLALFLEQGDELFLLGHQGVDLCGFVGQKAAMLLCSSIDGIGKDRAELFIVDALPSNPISNRLKRRNERRSLSRYSPRVNAGSTWCL